MVMESKRQHKFSRLILRDLADIFEHDYRNGFGEAFVTLTGVEMSPDLGIASVYVSVLPNSLHKQVMESIENKKSRIRGELGKKIGKQVRIIPELRFFADETEENAAHIESIFRNLEIPPEEESEESE